MAAAGKAEGADGSECERLAVGAPRLVPKWGEEECSVPAQYLLTIALHYTTPLSTKRLCYYRLQRPEPLPASRDTLAQVIKTLKVSRRILRVAARISC